MLMKLNESERQQVYKYVNIEDFKNCISRLKEGNIQKWILRVFQKPYHRLENSNKVKLIQYLEDHLYDEEKTDIELAFDATFFAKITTRFPRFPKLSALLKDVQYNNYDEHVRLELEGYRQDFENSKIRLDFELILKCLCDSDNKEALYEQMMKNLKDEIEEKNKEKDNLINGIKDLERINKDQEKKYKDLSKSYESLNKDYDKLNKEYQEYQNRFKVNEIVSKFSDFIDVNQYYSSYEEVYQILCDKEQVYLRQNEYYKLKALLSAKYALVMIMGE